MDYLIHFNSNHSPKNGQFIRGDGDKDGIVDDHAHRRKGDRRRDPRDHKPENPNPNGSRSGRTYSSERHKPGSNRPINRTYDENKKVLQPNFETKTFDARQPRHNVSNSSRNLTFKERESIPGKITTVGNRDFVKSNSGKSSDANSAYTSKGSNYVTSVKNVSVRKLVNDEEDKKNQSGYDPMDHRHREPSTYDYMHYNPYQTRSYQTAEDKHQHYVDAVEKGLTNNKSTYTDKYRKTSTR